MRLSTPLSLLLSVYVSAQEQQHAAAELQKYETDFQTALTRNDVAWSANTTLSFPGSDTFFNATERWSIANQPTYFAAISPATEQDVAQAVKIAVQNKVPFLATGGRHGRTNTLGELQQGLAIDLSQLTAFSADTENSTVTLGGAAVIGQFQDRMFDAGLMLPGGSCACPGYNGIGLGGGIGRYMGMFGVVSDRLVSANVVTAKGDLVTASETENSDLFWALRGAGANFGVVTSATYKAEKMSDHDDGNVLTVDFYLEANSTAAYFEYLAKVGPTLPANAAGIHITLWNDTIGQAQVLANWVWFGPEQEGRDFLAQFIRFSPHPVQNYVYIPWNKVLSVSLAGFGDTAVCVDGTYQFGYSDNMKEWTTMGTSMQETFEKLSQWLLENPGSRVSNTNFEIFSNEAIAAVPDDATAYNWRDTKAYFVINMIVDDPSDQALVAAADAFALGLHSSWNETGGYAEVGGAVYLNYAAGTEPIEARYGAAKLPKLAQLKQKWDPDNVFAYSNVIPASYP